MLASDTETISTALRWHEASKGVAVATVVATWGSSPRPLGSRLVINSEGQFLGSVSGGCVEGDVIAEASEIIKSRKPRLMEFGVSDELAWKAGLSCGGRIQVYVQNLNDGLAGCLAKLIAARNTRRSIALLIDMQGGPPRVVHLDECGSDPTLTQVEALLREERSGLIDHPKGKFFVSVQTEQTRIVIVGAVHVAQALASMAKLVDMDVTIVDPRTAFVNSERFPETRLVDEWPSDALPKMGLDRATAIALLSHDPRIDDQALHTALQSDCFYIGALGSRRTHARRLERMRAAGWSEANLGRINAPIGLDIGAANPAEIAVAALAQIVATRRRALSRTISDRAA